MFRTATKRASDYTDIRGKLYPDLGSRIGLLKINIRVIPGALASIANFVRYGPQRSPPPADESVLCKNAVRYDVFLTRALAQSRASNSDAWAQGVESHAFTDGNPLALYQLFSDYRHFHCSDPRDRVCGLLGPADDGEARELYVDYEESVQDVSVRLSKYLIRNGLGYLLLYYSSYAMSQYPSWAISLKDVKESRGFLEGRMTSGRPKDQRIFRAAGKILFEYEISPNLDRWLMTRGIILASVMSLTSEAPPSIGWSVEDFSIGAAVWGASTSLWMHEVAAWIGLSETDLRSKCFRTLLADLEYNGDGMLEWAGDNATSVSLQKTLEFWFPPSMTDGETLGERLKYRTLTQYLREAKEARVSSQLLMRTIQEGA